MPKAVWNGKVIAQCDETVVVEGNHYFPPESVDSAVLEASDARTWCPWKGTASYFHIVVNGAKKEDAAWYYPNPKDEAKHIRDHVAFWRGVEVEV